MAFVFDWKTERLCRFLACWGFSRSVWTLLQQTISECDWIGTSSPVRLKMSAVRGTIQYRIRLQKANVHRKYKCKWNVVCVFEVSQHSCVVVHSVWALLCVCMYTKLNPPTKTDKLMQCGSIACLYYNKAFCSSSPVFIPFKSLTLLCSRQNPFQLSNRFNKDSS